MYKLDLEQAEEPLVKLPTFIGSQRKERNEKKKKIYFRCIDYTKTRDLFKKIREAKGTFHAKMGSIKDRNGTDLTEAEDIKKKW